MRVIIQEVLLRIQQERLFNFCAACRGPALALVLITSIFLQATGDVTENKVIIIKSKFRIRISFDKIKACEFEGINPTSGSMMKPHFKSKSPPLQQHPHNCLHQKAKHILFSSLFSFLHFLLPLGTPLPSLLSPAASPPPPPHWNQL